MPEPSPTWNSGICCSRLARSLFSTMGAAGGSILTGARLARRPESTLRIWSRSSRKARASLHSLACLPLLRDSLPSTAGSARVHWPMRSITASHDNPVASVTEIRNRLSRNRLAPRPPNMVCSELPTNRPSTPPLPAQRSLDPTTRSFSNPQLETRKPTIPTNRSAGPRSTWPSPSVSIPNSAIHATAPSTKGSRNAT